MRQVFISLLVVALLIPVVVICSGCQGPTEEELAELENQVNALMEELADKQEVVDGLQDELGEKSNEIDMLLADIAEQSGRIEKLEAELAELQEFEEVTPRVFGIEYYHSKGWRVTFDDYAEDQGWTVLNIHAETLTCEYLEQQGVSILHIPDVKIAYTEEEREEIVRFVENGGGLLIKVPEYRTMTDEITEMFGVRIDLDFLGSDQMRTVQPYHPLARDVSTLLIDRNTSFLTISPPAYDVLQPPIKHNYRPLIAAGEIGAGRFVFCPRYYDLDAEDNSNFLRNVFYWLEQVNLP